MKSSQLAAFVASFLSSCSCGVEVGVCTKVEGLDVCTGVTGVVGRSIKCEASEAVIRASAGRCPESSGLAGLSC